MKKITAVFSLIALFSTFSSVAQQSGLLTETLEWSNTLHRVVDKSFTIYEFQDCDYDIVNEKATPVYFKKLPVSNDGMRAKISNITYQSPQNTITWADNIPGQFKIKQYITFERAIPYLNIEFVPAVKNGNSIQVFTGFDISLYQAEPNTNAFKLKKANNFKSNSVLASGEWHKFAIPSDGVYKITGNQLKALGIDVSNLSAKTIKIFAIEGGPLNEVISITHTDDLGEIPVELFDVNGNDRMDADDFLRFYAEGPDAWELEKGQYVYNKNVYTENAYVFLTFGGNDALKLSTKASGQGGSVDTTLDFFYHLIHHEKEEVNFIQSGRYWYGDEFRSASTKQFSHTFQKVRNELPAYFSHQFAARSIQYNASAAVSLNGENWHSFTSSGVDGAYDETFGRLHSKKGTFNLSANSLLINYNYNLPGEGNGWVDFYSIAVPTNLEVIGSQTVVRSKEAALKNQVQFAFTTGSYTIWNVTDIFSTGKQLTFSANGKDNAILFTNTDPVKFALFTSGSEKTAEHVAQVKNQNLHAASSNDFIIISHPDFLPEAERLANFHRDFYQQSVLVVNVRDIYNEFSGGRQDVTGIREFIRMHYKRSLGSSVELQNVLLLGDGSYDFLNRVDENTNFIPTFQSRNTVDPVNSYSADDYFAILDDGEGYYDIFLAPEALDIGVGRIPCRNISQAKTMVNKIIHYHDPVTFGDWQNRITFLGDDEDGGRHLDDSEIMAGYVKNQEPVFNVGKIYLDAYEQKSFGSGEKYPDVNLAVTKAFEKGTLIFNYLGHGGTSGMAHERVVTRDEIRNWDNYDKLPLMVTATCELSRFDDPAQDSPGELMLFNDHGGAVGLVSTMRLVQITLNTELSRQIWNKNIVDLHGGRKQLGIFFRDTKNNSKRAVNQRNFSLLGDPAMELSFPDYQVNTTSINDSILGVHQLDTFKAFSKIKVTGVVRKPNNQIATDFNGFVYPTVFDKYLDYQSLGNDENLSPIRTYSLQNSVLYRGKVSVKAGEFSFQFVVPKDISYNFGKGKISYFAEDGAIDGHGFDTAIVVGGSISDVVDDKTGPTIDLLLNDDSWVFGGTTNSSPILIGKVFDLNGINTVGNGIGRDITAIIDAGTENEQIIVLNDFYQSKLDSYQEGEIRYQMEGLSPGKHTLKLRVWDVYNNASEDNTEFIVADDAELTLNHVINFPNPFTTSTTFHFDHNKAGMGMDVLIQVITTTGRIVQSFNYSSVAASSHFAEISWDGKDSFGDQLARGVYLYKVTVKTEDGNKAEKTQKLVILK